MMEPDIDANWHDDETMMMLRAEIDHLRKTLQWYADASQEDFAKDNGFNATAALAAHQQKPPPDDHPLLRMGEDLRPTALKAR